MATPNQEFQDKAVSLTKEYFQFYSQLLNWYRTTWLSLFRAIYIYETDRKGTGKSQVFWPILYRETQKVADRLTSNNPKFVVSLNVPINPDSPEADMAAYEQVNQKALNYFWKISNSQAKLRSWGKQGVDYGVSFALVDFERKTHKTKTSEQIVNKKGELVEKIIETEEILYETPTFEVPDLFDVYFDPRITFTDDMPCIILNKDDVRLSELLSNKDIYFNLDKLKDLSGNNNGYSTDGDNSKLNKFNQEGIPTIGTGSVKGVNVKTYYGYFSETGEAIDEEMWKFVIVNDLVLIQADKINFMPFEKFVPIEVPGQGVGKGVAEPIKKLQDAYNLVRNQRLENMAVLTNKVFKMKQGSGIDPRKVVMNAGNIIPMKDLDALQVIDTPDVSPSTFSETQALNTEIQSINSTIDASQDNSGNGFTNLATGQRIRWNEFNTRFKAIKNNLEESLARLGMKMLMMTAERAKQNPIIKDQVTNEFYHVAKDAFDSISDFYSVNVIAGSTAYDNMENQRDESLAKWNLLVQAKAQGINVDLTAGFKEVMQTFPGTDMNTLISPIPPAQPAQQGGGSIPQATIDQAQVQPSPDAALSESLTNV